MQKPPIIIIISGPMCTGKTTIGRQLAKKYSLPFISKDNIKESLFDSLGWSDRELSLKLGSATYPLMFQFAKTLLKSKNSFIIESNFDNKFADNSFLELKRKNYFSSILIQCETDGEILFERFKERSESGKRHLGHRDHLNYRELKDRLLRGKSAPLNICDNIFNVNTTNFTDLNLKPIFFYLDNYLNKY